MDVPLLGDEKIGKNESLQNKPAEQVHLYSVITGYCFSANYIIGVGLLGVPNAFAKAGLLLSSLILLGGTILSCLTIVYLLEAISRAQAYLTYTSQDDRSIALNSNNNATPSSDIFKIGTLKLEVNELLGLFVGKWAQNVFLVLLGLYLYISLWSYSAVFSSSLLSLVPFPGVSLGYVCDIYNATFPAVCNESYLLYMLLFFLIVAPLICMDLTEQVALQIILCLFRFGAIFLMFITTLIAMYNTPYSRNDQGPSPFISYTKLFDISGFGTIFPTAVFSQLLHHSIPGLVQPVKQKSWLRTMFSLALLSTFTLYIFLAVPSVMYFGEGVKPVISLNWKDYSGLSFDGPNAAPVWAKIISYIVVLFPVFDIISAFPLNGITLANTIFASLPGSITRNGSSHWVKIATRFLVAVPPIILGSIIKRLDLIIELAGTVGFFIAFVVPAFLAIFSARKAKQTIGRSETPYSIPILSHPITAGIIIVFGIGSFIYQCVSIGQRIADGSLHM